MMFIVKAKRIVVLAGCNGQCSGNCSFKCSNLGACPKLFA